MSTNESRSENPRLQPFDVIELPTPKVPKPTKKKEAKKHSRQASRIHLILDTVLLWSSVAWIACIILYGTVPWLRSPVNAWYHTKSFNVFMAFGILWRWVFMKFIRSILRDCAPSFGVAPAIISVEECLAYLPRLTTYGLGIFGIVMVCVGDPIVRTCTRDDFPVHFRLWSVKDSVRGIVEVERHDGNGIWDMAHYPLQSNPNIYVFTHLRDRKRDNNIFNNVTWPQQSAVREMVYDFSQNNENPNIIMGYCGSQKERCLNGTIQLDPLRFEWTYTDPLTSEVEHKILDSEGRWNFGRRHRPLVQLRDSEGDLVFSAPSSTVACGGGDGDLRTAIVPVGMVIMAEQEYLGRY
jgi:hypothetical protein